jgi:protein-S-isoprenylcysteine O-methyltransferase Ste14
MERLSRWAELVCWATFAVVWIVGAIYNVRRAPPAAARGTPFGVTLTGLAATLLLWSVVPRSVWRALTASSVWSVGVGVAVLVIGTAFTLWARFELGTMWTSTAVVKEGHRLVTDGPYRVTRHPIYTGLLGMLLGTVVIEGLGRWLVVLIVAVIVLSAKIRSEERLLGRELGEPYEVYRRRVPALVPLPFRRSRA